MRRNGSATRARTRYGPFSRIVAGKRRAGTASTIFLDLARTKVALVYRAPGQVGHTPRSGRAEFLDFGCGVGRISRVLMQHFSDGFGIDVSETMIEKAKAFSASDPGQARYIKNTRGDLSLIASDRIGFRLFPHRASARAGRLSEQVYRGVHSHPEAGRRCRVSNSDRERRKRRAEKDSRDQEGVASDIAVCPAHARQTGPGQGRIRCRRIDGYECLHPRSSCEGIIARKQMHVLLERRPTPIRRTGTTEAASGLCRATMRWRKSPPGQPTAPISASSSLCGNSGSVAEQGRDHLGIDGPGGVFGHGSESRRDSPTRPIRRRVCASASEATS